MSAVDVFPGGWVGLPGEHVLCAWTDAGDGVSRSLVLAPCGSVGLRIDVWTGLEDGEDWTLVLPWRVVDEIGAMVLFDPDALRPLRDR